MFDGGGASPNGGVPWAGGYTCADSRTRSWCARRRPGATGAAPDPARSANPKSNVVFPAVRARVPSPAPAQRSPPPETLLQPPVMRSAGRNPCSHTQASGAPNGVGCSIRASMPMDAAWNPNLVPTLGHVADRSEQDRRRQAGSLTAHPERASGSGSRHSLCR